MTHVPVSDQGFWGGHAPKLWVLASSGGQLAYSLDKGVSWTKPAALSAVFDCIADILYFNGLHVAVGWKNGVGAKVALLDEHGGLVSSMQPWAGVNGRVVSAKVVNNRLVIAGCTDVTNAAPSLPKISVSTDGINFTPKVVPYTIWGSIFSVWGSNAGYFDGTTLVFSGWDGSTANGNAAVWYSPDQGDTWSIAYASSLTYSQVVTIANTGGVTLTSINQGDAEMRRSTNLTSWSSITRPAGSVPSSNRSLEGGNGYFVCESDVGGNAYLYAATAADTNTWTQVANLGAYAGYPNSAWARYVPELDMWYAAAQNGHVYTTATADPTLTWTDRGAVLSWAGGAYAIGGRYC